LNKHSSFLVDEHPLQETAMKVLPLALAMLGALLVSAAADTMPKIGSEKLCKARAAGEKMMHLAELESVADCVREENQAKEALGALWDATDRTIRDRCKADSVALGTLSYLDLLTCIQTANDLKSPLPAVKPPSSNPSRR
jgi:hypothetical protein